MNDVEGFKIIMLFAIGALLFAFGVLLFGKLIRPHRPNAEKLSTYESGEEPSGTAWGRFNVRFYIIALVFLLFEAELVFLFPWAVAFGDQQLLATSNELWAWFTLAEVFIFIFFLGIGLAYVWSKGMLKWIKAKPKLPTFQSAVPKDLYQKFNERY